MMPEQKTLVELVFSGVENIEQLKMDVERVRQIKKDFVEFLYERIRKDGAFFRSYHLSLVQEEARRRFPIGSEYFSKNFFFEVNTTFKEALRIKGATPLRSGRMIDLAESHPDYKENQPIIIPDKATGILGLYYKDKRKAGAYIASVCNKKVQEDGKQFLTLKPEYARVIFGRHV